MEKPSIFDNQPTFMGGERRSKHGAEVEADTRVKKDQFTQVAQVCRQICHGTAGAMTMRKRYNRLRSMFVGLVSYGTLIKRNA